MLMSSFISLVFFLDPLDTDTPLIWTLSVVSSVSVLTVLDWLTVPAIAFLFNFLGTVKEQIGRNTKLHALLPKK